MSDFLYRVRIDGPGFSVSCSEDREDDLHEWQMLARAIRGAMMMSSYSLAWSELSLVSAALDYVEEVETDPNDAEDVAVDEATAVFAESSRALIAAWKHRKSVKDAEIAKRMASSGLDK